MLDFSQIMLEKCDKLEYTVSAVYGRSVAAVSKFGNKLRNRQRQAGVVCR